MMDATKFTIEELRRELEEIRKQHTELKNLIQRSGHYRSQKETSAASTGTADNTQR